RGPRPRLLAAKGALGTLRCVPSRQPLDAFRLPELTIAPPLRTNPTAIKLLPARASERHGAEPIVTPDEAHRQTRGHARAPPAPPRVQSVRQLRSHYPAPPVATRRDTPRSR